MGFSKDHFISQMDKLVDLMGFRIGKRTIEAMFEKVCWCDPRALKHAIYQMEDEDRWSSKAFLKHIRWKNAILREEQVDNDKANDFRRHVELTRQSEDCQGGDRCRKCDIKFCNTISAHGYEGVFDVIAGKRTVDEVNSERDERYPVNQPF